MGLVRSKLRILHILFYLVLRRASLLKVKTKMLQKLIFSGDTTGDSSLSVIMTSEY